MTLACTIVLLLGSAPLGNEPVIGGPCQGCELVFDGIPETLSVHSRIAPTAESGERLQIEGVVRTPDGEPASGIIIYAYQTNAGGVYPKGPNQHGALRGWARTDASGKYRFDTIRPGAYPGRTIPQHVHMHVIEPGKGTYYIHDVLFDDDPLLKDSHRTQARRARGGSGLATPRKDDNGTWHVRRDIRLGERIPGYE